MRKTSKGLLLITILIAFIVSAEEKNMDTTSINSYLQKRDMKYIDKYRNLYGTTKNIILADGSKIYLSIGEKDVDEIHYFTNSSLNNHYKYDERGSIQFEVNYFGDIELYRITYDSARNILKEEKGRVFEAAFSLDKLKELVKRVYEVDLDTLASKNNQEYQWGEIQFNYSPYFKQYVYAIHIKPPVFENGATVRIVIIGSEKGEILDDSYLYAEY